MDHLRITVEGKTYAVTVEKVNGDPSPTQPPSRPVVRAAAPAEVTPTLQRAAGASAGDAPSPLAGIVQAIDAMVGSTVKEGDLVITLEAMKMFTPINAPISGTISVIHVKVGDPVEEGQVLYSIG